MPALSEDAVLRAVVILCAVVSFALVGCTRAVHEHGLFHPSVAEQGLWLSPPSIHGTRVEPLALKVGGAVLRGWEYQPADPDAAILYFYAQDESVPKIAQRLGRLARYLNARVLAMDYRGYAFTAGRPSLDALADDALVLYDAWLAPQQRTGLPGLVYGRSLGAAMALHVAARCDVDGVVLEAPFARLDDIVPSLQRKQDVWTRHVYRLRADDALVRRTQPIDLAGDVNAPLLVIHGRADRIAPTAGGQEIVRAAGSTTRTFLPIDGVSHYSLDPFAQKPLAAMHELLVMGRRYATARRGDAGLVGPPVAIDKPHEPTPSAQPEEAEPLAATSLEPVNLPALPVSAADPAASPEPAPSQAAVPEPIATPELPPIIDLPPPPADPQPSSSEPVAATQPIIGPTEPAAEATSEPANAETIPAPIPDTQPAREPVADGAPTSQPAPETAATTQPTSEPVPATLPAAEPTTQPPARPEPDRSKGVWIRGPGWQRLMEQRKERRDK